MVLLVGVTVLLATSLAFGLSSLPSSSPAPDVSVVGEFDGDERAVTLVHRGGDPIELDNLEILVEVDGVPLEHQPPIPFFSATGFAPGPEGVFNLESDSSWEAGEAGTFSIASTNDPVPTAESELQVTVVVQDQTIAVLTLTASERNRPEAADSSAAAGTPSRVYDRSSTVPAPLEPTIRGLVRLK